MTDPTVQQMADTAFDAGTTAINAAHIAAAAIEDARASDTASLLARVDNHLREYSEANNKYLKKTITDVLADVFGKEESTFVVKNRVPLLCQSVISMKGDISDIKLMMSEQYKTFVTKEGEYSIMKMIVFGVAGSMGLAAVGSFIRLILIK